MRDSITLFSMLIGFAMFMTSCNDSSETKSVDTSKIPVKGEMVAELTSPPLVPKPVGKRDATKLKVSLEIL